MIEDVWRLLDTLPTSSWRSVLVPAESVVALLAETATILRNAGQRESAEQLARAIECFLTSQQAAQRLHGVEPEPRSPQPEELPAGRRKPVSGRRLPNRPWYGPRRMR